MVRARLKTTARLGLFLSLLFGHVPASADGAEGTRGGGGSAAIVSLALQPALFDVTVNGQSADEPAEFLRDRAGRLYISASFLRGWRIRLPATGAVDYEGQAFYPASALPALRLNIAEQAQSVAITADASAFEGQTAALNGADTMEMTPAATGAFLNYDLFADHYRGETSVNGAFTAGFFTRAGAGTTSFIASAGGGETRVTRLETTWTIDRPNNMTSIRLGDAISSSGPGGAPVRFAGVQYVRNFAVQPGYITMPLPVATGSAAVPSVVDVYVNSTLQGEQQVTPGPFELSHIPVPSGGGTVQLVVRDLLGREMVTDLSYYASAQLLRRGLHDFSYEAGFLREDFGRRSNQYGSFFASTSHRYGFSDHLTGEATAQASKSSQMVGGSLTGIVFDLAQVGGSVSVSHADAGWGFHATAAVERHARAFSVGLIADYTSTYYRVIGVPDDRLPPRYTIQAFADLTLPHGGIGMNLLYRSYRDQGSETIAGVFGTWQVSRQASFQLYARYSVLGKSEASFGGHISLALGGRRSASISADRHGGTGSATISYQDDPPAGPGGGFRASARLGEASFADATYVHNFPSATLTAQATYARGAPGVRLSARGAIGIMDGHVFTSRSLGDSFAAVHLNGYGGVHVYADNQPIGVTDASGFLIVPGLRPYDRNTIRIDADDLPLDAALANAEIDVRPYGGAGVGVRFNARRERGVLMHVRLEDGSNLPAGTQVTLEGGAETYVAVSGGALYVPDPGRMLNMRATWGGRSCRFTAAVPAGDDVQPRLDDIVCREDPHYATR
jgi:outer membrane usher protein